MRLTRRGQVVVVIAMGVSLLVGFWLGASRNADATSRPERVLPAMESVVVGRQDSLWAIASRNRPGVDPRVTVRRIIDLNGLRDPIVHPGQRLLLPTR